METNQLSSKGSHNRKMKSVVFLQKNSVLRCFAQTPFSTMFIRKVTFSGKNNKSIAVASGNAPSLAVVIVTEVVSGHGWTDVEVK